MRTFLQSLPSLKTPPHLFSFHLSLSQTKLLTLGMFGLFLEFIMMIIFITQGNSIKAILSGIFLFIFILALLCLKKTSKYLNLLNFGLMLFFEVALEEIFEAEKERHHLVYGLTSQMVLGCFAIGQEWYLSLAGLVFNSVYFISRNRNETEEMTFAISYLILSAALIILTYLLYVFEKLLLKIFAKHHETIQEVKIWNHLMVELNPNLLILFRRESDPPAKSELPYQIRTINRISHDFDILSDDDFLCFSKKVSIEGKIKETQRSHRFFSIEKEEVTSLYEVMKLLCGTVFFKKEEKGARKRKKETRTKNGGPVKKPTNIGNTVSNNLNKQNKKEQETSLPPQPRTNDDSMHLKKHLPKPFQTSAQDSESFQSKIYHYYGKFQRNQKVERKVHIILTFFVWDGETHCLFTMEDIQNQLETHTFKKINVLASSIIEKINEELVAPLNRSIILLDQAAADVTAEERMKLIELSRMDSNLLLHMLNDILDYFRIKNNCFKLDPTQFSLALLLNEVIELIKNQCFSKGIVVKITNNCDLLLTVYSDPRRLMQVLINMISNSLKFTLKGYIEILVNSIKIDNFAYIKFEILDTGTGIKKDMLNSIYKVKPDNKSFEDLNVNDEKEEKDFSVNNADIMNGGRGLGIMISKSLIGNLGPLNEIYASSEIQKGTKFGFLIFENINDREEYLKLRKTSVISKKLNLEGTFTNFMSHVGDPSCLLRIDEDEPLNYSVRKFPMFINLFGNKLESDNNLAEEYRDYIYVPAKKKLNLLIVDENTFMIYAMNNILKKIREYQINSDFCTNGLNALDLFEKNNYITSKSCYDYVILNCQMQFMSGYVLSKKIKEKIEKDHYKKTTIIGFSSSNTPEEEANCRAHGIKIVINKIASEQEIISKFRKIFKE